MTTPNNTQEEISDFEWEGGSIATPLSGLDEMSYFLVSMEILNKKSDIIMADLCNCLTDSKKKGQDDDRCE